ncbi:predicted protein [Micromonas commoda]|uniref:Uncharacterized protein n=1 Tax=Micromonas commoda (strain RCC299 / NOUM17 / CCMP2709) TaxID=296587 RepID=C1FGF8_MICCC|nr:predicted protein [Micromonas commoda]ACO69250.1 predicted protein [Micromonas commoda]|eukprot:XP_002507992.1 predicted protein [Micromonas commoda]
MTVPSTPPRPPASPKFQLPPTTVSPGPGGTRLERVLDLVTSHEATIAENELRVLDLTKRVAEAEDAARARRDEDRRARDAADASLRAELAAVKEAVRRVERDVASWSDERDALRAEVRDLADGCRADADAALEETKAGFKAVLQDVVDRVAASLDAVRTDAVATRGNYASADEVAALRERFAAAESAARAKEAHGRETMNAMLDAMEQMKRRTAKLVGFYNEQLEAAERRRAAGAGPSTDSFGFSSGRSGDRSDQTGELARLLEENASLREQLARASSSRPGHHRAAVEEAALACGSVEEAVRRTGSFDSLDGDGADAKLTRSIRDSIGSVNGC